MLRIDKFKDGRWRSIDLHDLPVGETWAHKLTGADLFRELNRLGVKDINSSMGWQDLALAWGNILADRKEASQA